MNRNKVFRKKSSFYDETTNLARVRIYDDLGTRFCLKWLRKKHKRRGDLGWEPI